MPPELKELLAPTRLPEADAYFNDRTVSALPACGAHDAPMDERVRILVSPTDSTAYFPRARHVSPTTTFLDLDDPTLRRVLTATGGFLYNRTLTGANGREIPLGPGIAHLCRSESAENGRYRTFIAENDIINNAPGQTSVLHRIDFRFSYGEIESIVESGILTGDHYRVAPNDHELLEIYPDETNVHRLIRFVEGSSFARKADMVAALNNLLKDLAHQGLDLQRQGLDMQRHMQVEMRWQNVGMVVFSILGSIYTGMLLSGKAGPVHRALSFPFRGLYHGARYLFDGGQGWSRFWNEATAGLRYAGIPTLLEIGTNMTEQARLGEFRRVADATTPQVAAQIENTLHSRHNTMSVLVEGPPGWGKEEIMKTLALRNPRTVFIQITPNAMMGNTMYRGQLEQRINDIPKQILRARKAGRQVVLFVDEFHEALSAGKSQESSVSLLEHWKGALARGDIRIVGFSTPRELLKARFIAGVYNDAAARARLSPEFQAEIARFEKDGVRQNLELRPLLNRFQPVILPARGADDIVSILKDKIGQRREGNGLEILMDDGILKRVSELSESLFASEGMIPRTALALFNGVIDANAEAGSASVTVDLARLDDYVGKNYPDIARRFAAAPDPTAIFTQDHFVELIRRRCPGFFNADGTVKGNFRSSVQELARLAHRSWTNDPAHPLTTVDGHTFPHEDVVDRVLREAVARLETARHPSSAAFRRLVETGRERAAETRGVEGTSDSFREAGRRLFELTVKH